MLHWTKMDLKQLLKKVWEIILKLTLIDSSLKLSKIFETIAHQNICGGLTLVLTYFLGSRI